MNCCLKCFDDTELRGLISSESSNSGNCDYCGNEGIKLIDTKKLEEKFIPLVQIYDSVTDTSRTDINPKLLHEKVHSEWGVFSRSLNSDKRKQLLRDILSESYNANDEIFLNLVERKVILQDLDQAETHEKEWEQFVEEIKLNNRFFLGKNIDLELLENLFAFHTRTYPKGTLFYRARISPKEGYPLDEMGKPPVKKSASGRANPVGIPYLYLGSSQKTVLKECRATHLDFVSIATFKLKGKLKVVSLQQVENISPFLLEEKIDNYLKNQQYIKRLENELSKPIRKEDSKLDYLPTQYICEYVKFLGYDGIEYGSSMHNNGLNLAVFNEGSLEPIKVELHEVISIDLETKIIDTK